MCFRVRALKCAIDSDQSNRLTVSRATRDDDAARTVRSCARARCVFAFCLARGESSATTRRRACARAACFEAQRERLRHIIARRSHVARLVERGVRARARVFERARAVSRDVGTEAVRDGVRGEL